MTTRLNTYEELLLVVKNRNLVVVEGPRCSGKSFLIQKLILDTNHAYYETLFPRKDYMNSRGNLDLPANLDVQQAGFWVFDFLRQIPTKVIMNRSMLSSMYWDGYHPERFAIWQAQLQRLGGLIVFCQPSWKDHKARINKANRSKEYMSIAKEKRKLSEIGHQIDESLICWYLA